MTAAVPKAPSAVPVPTPGGGTGNRFPEPVGTTGNSLPVFETLADFLARAALEAPRDWLVPGIVPDRGRLLIVAPTNAGKTWVALLASLAASKAGRTVFFIEEEGSARALADRMAALCIPGSPRIHVAHLKAVMLDDNACRAMLRDLLAEAEAPVMVLDPLVSLWRGDENSTRDANQMRAHLDELARANPRALLIVLHHTSKAAARGDGPETFAGRGSSVFPGWADVQLNLSPVPTAKGSGVFEVDASVSKDREGERGLKKRIRIVLGTGDVSLDDTTDSSNEGLRGVVLDVLGTAMDGLTKAAIVTASRRQRARVLKLVDVLVNEGVVTLVGGIYRLAAPCGLGGDQ